MVTRCAYAFGSGGSDSYCFDNSGVEIMEFEQALEESRSMKGSIGAASYVALKILAASGADDEQLGQLRILLNQGLDLLTEDDRMVLTYVLDQRVSESHGRVRILVSFDWSDD